MSTLTSDQVNDLLAAHPGAAVYLVGIGGCGMSGLAHLLLDLGHRVAGSDLVVNEEIRQLRERGATIHAGHAAEHIASARPFLAIFTPAVIAANPELAWARQASIPVIRRATLLAALVHRQRGICVSGMHGKTTTSALLAFALHNLSANPSHAIGALVPQLGCQARLAWSGTSATTAPPPWFVVEADESDGTLRGFHPEHAIVLNVDAEHLDHYAGIDAVCEEFRAFSQQVRGTLVFCADDPRLREMFAGRVRTISYGFAVGADYQITRRQAPVQESPQAPIRSAFEVEHRGAPLGTFKLRQHGEKNISNAGAVVALLHQLGYAPEAIASAIAEFAGVVRRQEELFADERFRVFDDYGHHPAEIEATLRLFKELNPRRLLVAFQPHRYTRTKTLLGQFATCFRDADRLWLTEIYAASEPPIAGVTGLMLAETVRATRQAVEFVPSLDALRGAVRAAMLPGDIAVFLGAGDITRIAHELATELRIAR